MSKESDIAKSFQFTDTVCFPLEMVYPIFRNEFIKLINYFPNIRQIDTITREEIKGGAHVVLKWYGKVKLPGLAAKLIPEDKIFWIDDATWNDKAHCVEYAMTLPALSDAVRVEGKNEFSAQGNNTHINLTGRIITDIDKIKLAPKMVLKSVVPGIEAFALKLTKPNFMELNRGVEKYLRAKK